MSVYAGSILDNGTKAAPGVLYYGGGGGPATSTFVTAEVSTLSVSSISAIGGGPVEFTGGAVFPSAVSISSITSGNNPAGTVIQNGLNFAPGAGILFDPNPAAAPTIEWSAGDGEMTGVSTINGVPYPPAAPAPPANSGMTAFTFQSGGNFYVPAGGATVPMASFSTQQFHLYQLEMPFLRVQNEPVGVPQAGAWADMTIDTAVNVTYLETFDMASVSTIQNDLQKAAVYSFIASGSNHTMSANGNLGNTLSTAITVLGKAYLKDLGDITSYPSAN